MRIIYFIIILYFIGLFTTSSFNLFTWSIETKLQLAILFVFGLFIMLISKILNK